MPDTEIELNPVDFVTVGTVGPKGRRVFHLQAGQGSQVVTLVIEKQQAQALAEAVKELLDDLKEKHPELPETDVNLPSWDMSLRDPVDPLFRVAQMGLGYDEERNLVVLVAQELIASEEGEEETVEPQPQVVRLWATREQMRALGEHAQGVIKKGRADPRSNGYLIYYWT
jgi:uncharacterized repeat protein (TIGR03847 family)